jgi:hypothetical protein
VKVLEYEDHIEVLETELDTFQMCHFDVVECDDHEGGFGELDQAICGGLTEDVGSEWDTVEAKFTERNINIDVLILASLSDLLCESLELAIKVSTSSSLFLFLLEFFLVTISEFALSISGLIKLDVGSFSVELDVLGLLLTNQNRILEVNVDDNDQFVLARLEEQMLYVAEENIHSVEGVQWRLISETVLVNLNLSWHTLTIHSRTNEDVVHDSGSTI